MKKFCFITYHNWQTKRHGGFHQFAKYIAEKGNEVVFFSFSRPYYIRWKHEERLNQQVLHDLTQGRTYKIGKGILHNVTWPTFGIPGPMRRFFSYGINEMMITTSLTPFYRFKKRWLTDTDCFIFESCEGILLAKKIKKEFPKAKIIYRPSDPLWEFSNDFFNIKGEAEILETADKILTVNDESIEGYKYKFPELFDKSKFKCIPNGVNLQEYQKTHEVPELIKDCTSACYIGAFLPDWNILTKTAKALPNIKFIIITPHSLDEETNKIVSSLENLIYIDGISSTEVPKWITNCTVVLQPFPKEYGHLDKLSLGLTAKNYKAIAAHKPIVTYGIPLKLSKYGLITTNTLDDFIKGIKVAINNKFNLYENFNIITRDWDRLCAEFLLECNL